MGHSDNRHSEQVSVTRPLIEGVELMHAQFLRHNFSKHFHKRYAIGIIEHGAMEFNFLGRDHVAESGQVNLTIPGEPHDGHSADSTGWAYRMFYIEPALVERTAVEVLSTNPELPGFTTGVLHDLELAALVRAGHLLMESPHTSQLTQEVALKEILALWLSRHSTHDNNRRRAGQEPHGIAITRQYLDDCPGDDISLSQLARLANLSEHHFIRVFRKHVGVPPHMYLLQSRIRTARKLLGSTMRLADIAQDTGFNDQAHFSNAFKRIMGVTPGKYRKFLQTNQ